MFEGFAEQDVNGVHLVTAGDGPPLLLVHGYPQTHAIWHRVAPGLVDAGHRVVCPDLRGYGASHKPPSGDSATNYSKRTMATELVDVMARLGHERFAVAGHDRGGRVAYRMALDHPANVTRLATLDIVPTVEQWDQLNGTAGIYSFHWHFLAQPHPFPERFIGADPEYWLRSLCGRWAASAEALEEAMPLYVHAFDADTIRATCDDYRAGAGIDVRLDREDRDAGRRIRCPLLAMWGDPTGRRPTLDTVWRRWADDVSGVALRCGHFLAEEAPGETLAALRDFFRS
jgi:haloacetate dehalogenase